MRQLTPTAREGNAVYLSRTSKLSEGIIAGGKLAYGLAGS